MSKASFKDLTIEERGKLAALIAMFLVRKEKPITDNWMGRMTKSEQWEAFGFYMGKGLIVVDGLTETVSHTVSRCFGMDYEETCYVSANTGEIRGNEKFKDQFQGKIEND